MQHNRTKQLNETLDIYVTSVTVPITVVGYSIIGGVMTELIASYSIVDRGSNVYSCTVTLPGVDCLVVYVFGGAYLVMRVGNPPAEFLYCTGVTGESISYNRYLGDGSLGSSGSLVEYGYGVYTKVLSNTAYGYIEVHGVDYVIDIPYDAPVIINTSGGADSTFINVGYNMISYQGDMHSRFDSNAGQWVADTGVVAKAEDVVQAIVYMYGLSWDSTDSLYVGNYIEYVRSYTENLGLIRYYKPGITPVNNDANFELVQVDESGQTQVKGLDIFLKQTLETVGTTDGAVLQFR